MDALTAQYLTGLLIDIVLGVLLVSLAFSALFVLAAVVVRER